MSLPERPSIRPGLAAARDGDDPRFLLLWDRLRISDRYERVTHEELQWVQLFEGKLSVREIQEEAIRLAEGRLIPLEQITSLLHRLDDALFLDTERFRERIVGPTREPSCIGCYEGEPEALRRQLRGLFTGPGGPGLPAETTPDGRLRAALIPHIDYHRGGKTFAWGFKEVFERTNASLFVIIGTSHYSGERFTLTRQNFKTPLGIVPTDQAYIDRLEAKYGPGLFDDPFAHVPEHSIELEVVFLQYLYENRRPIRIVPLLVGSFHDCVHERTLPNAKNDIQRMVEALQQVEAETNEPICYIISGDLAHIGPKFGDRSAVDKPQLAHSRKQDEALVRHTEAADVAGYFQVIRDEADSRRICGLPPTYTALAAAKPKSGKLLHYDQYVHPKGHESVSFASVAFYQ